MRHRVYGQKLGRNKNERTALFKSLVQSILIHGTIQTSETKAKAIKGLIDKIINLAKSKNSKRLLGAYLTQKPLQERLIKEIAPKLADRTSGYTSTVKLQSRLGDNTRLVRMSIIGSEKLEPIKKEEKVKGQNAKVKNTVQKSKVPEKEKTGKPKRIARSAKKAVKKIK